MKKNGRVCNSRADWIVELGATDISQKGGLMVRFKKRIELEEAVAVSDEARGRRWRHRHCCGELRTLVFCRVKYI